MTNNDTAKVGGRSYNPVVAQMLRQHQKKEEELREKEGHLQ